MTRSSSVRRPRVIAARWLASACLVLVAACGSVPGAGLKQLRKLPEATLAYPASSNVVQHGYPGVRSNWVGHGGSASVGITADTGAPQADVISYYTTTLSTDGWTKTGDNRHDNSVPGRPMHTVLWRKGKLGFALSLWDGQYDTAIVSG
jgi:hypothetical protein